MVKLILSDSTIQVQLSTFELIFSFIFCYASALKQSINNVKNIRVTRCIYSEMRGIRIGTGLPYVIMLGCRWFWKGQDFCAVYYNKPSLIVEFNENSHYSRWLLTVDNPEVYVDALTKIRNNERNRLFNAD
jgi:hypothetical protein